MNPRQSQIFDEDYKLPEWRLQETFRLWEQEIRYKKAEDLEAHTESEYSKLEAIQQQFFDTAADRALRTEVDQALAEKLLDLADWDQTPLEDAMSLGRIACCAKECRHSGPVGLKPDGGLVIPWDKKCTAALFCPHASREESMRIAKWYVPSMSDFWKASPTHRIFAGVLTMPNVRKGDLKKGKAWMFDCFKHAMQMLDEKKITSVKHNDETGSYEEYTAVWPNIKGSLIVQEDPMSGRDDWNVHLNFILLVDGAFDYNLFRSAWHYRLHIDEIERGNEKELRAALVELIKYQAMHAQMKHYKKKAEGLEHAPAMLDWSRADLLEWYEASKNFRRVRSYGCLYSLERKMWEESDQLQRRAWCEAAGVDQAYAGRQWGKLPEQDAKSYAHKEWMKARNRLRDTMHGLTSLDLNEVTWVGQANYRNGIYVLDIAALKRNVHLIPEDNFSAFLDPNPSTDYLYPHHGPPDDALGGYL